MIEPGFTAIPASTVCLDCGAPISGNYCANCGQETKIETPTVRQFAHEMMDQYVAVEGKLGRTLRVLLSRPGQLTLDYVEGRRQRYVRPLKLYVSISVVFFTLLGVLPDSLSPFMHFDSKAAHKEGDKALQQAKQAGDDAAAAAATAKPAEGDAGDDKDGKDKDQADPAAATTTGPETAHPLVPAVPQPPKAPDAAPQAPDSGDLRQQIKQQIAADVAAGNTRRIGADVDQKVHDELRKAGVADGLTGRVKAFGALPADEQSKALRAKLADDAPYAMFFLLPYFAFLLRVLYRKNKLRYGVHLLFSVHLHCFAFVVLAVGFLPLPSFMRTLMELVIGVYVYFALHKVYGGTWARTLWRMALLYVFYGAGAAATAVSGVFSAVLGTGT